MVRRDNHKNPRYLGATFATMLISDCMEQGHDLFPCIVNVSESFNEALRSHGESPDWFMETAIESVEHIPNWDELMWGKNLGIFLMGGLEICEKMFNDEVVKIRMRLFRKS